MLDLGDLIMAKLENKRFNKRVTRPYFWHPFTKQKYLQKRPDKNCLIKKNILKIRTKTSVQFLNLNFLLVFVQTAKLGSVS